MGVLRSPKPCPAQACSVACFVSTFVECLCLHTHISFLIKMQHSTIYTVLWHIPTLYCILKYYESAEIELPHSRQSCTVLWYVYIHIDKQIRYMYVYLHTHRHIKFDQFPFVGIHLASEFLLSQTNCNVETSIYIISLMSMSFYSKQ